jgi:hypothetical protein
VGREGETYAYHIATHYDELADYTYFTQGTPVGHLRCPLEDLITNMNENKIPPGDLCVNQVMACDMLGRPHHYPLRIDLAWQQLFPNEPMPQLIAFYPGAQYLVPKERLKMRSRQWWYQLADLLASETICPWTIERLWPYAFNMYDTVQSYLQKAEQYGPLLFRLKESNS